MELQESGGNRKNIKRDSLLSIASYPVHNLIKALLIFYFNVFVYGSVSPTGLDVYEGWYYSEFFF